MGAIRVSCCCIWKDSDILFTYSSQCCSQEHRLTFSKLHYTRWVCACPHEQLCVWVHTFKYEVEWKSEKLTWQLVLVHHNSLYGFDCYLEQRMLEKYTVEADFDTTSKLLWVPTLERKNNVRDKLVLLGFRWHLISYESFRGACLPLLTSVPNDANIISM